jgi:uncharacterized protein YdaU (DUF1376 family)
VRAKVRVVETKLLEIFVESEAKVADNSGVGTALTVPNQASTVEGDDMATPTHSKRSPAFQFYPAEFLASRKVHRMSMTERGVYITLLCQCWLDNGLPTDLDELAEGVEMKPDQFKRMWTNGKGKLSLCFAERGGKLHHDRLDAERKKQSDYRRRQADNGAKGGRPTKSTGEPDNNPPLSERKALISSPLVSSDLNSSHSQGTARPQTIIRKRRMDAAFEHVSGMYVPQRAHDDLVPQHPPDFDLMPWYESVCKSWAGKATGDLIKFWKARHDETFPAERPAKSPWEPLSASIARSGRS